MRAAILSIFTLALLSAVPAVAGEVTLKITDVHRNGGVLMAQLCTQEEFLKRCTLHERAAASDDEVAVTFHNVAPGTYAAAIFQDVNDNAKLDRGPFGAPSEPWGISRNARNSFGPPAFEDAKVDVTDKPLTLKIGLN